MSQILRKPTKKPRKGLQTVKINKNLKKAIKIKPSPFDILSRH